MLCIWASVPSSTIITPTLLHSQQKPKAWDKSNDSPLAQGLGSWAPSHPWRGEWWGFLPEGGPMPGGCFCWKTWSGSGQGSVAVPSEHRLQCWVGSGLGWHHSSWGVSSWYHWVHTYPTLHVLSRSHLNTSELIAAVVSLLWSYVEVFLLGTTRRSAYLLLMHWKPSLFLRYSSCKFILSIFLLLPSQKIFSQCKSSLPIPSVLRN